MGERLLLDLQIVKAQDLPVLLCELFVGSFRPSYKECLEALLGQDLGIYFSGHGITPASHKLDGSSGSRSRYHRQSRPVQISA
jgi:hypothetical protein